MFNFLYNFVYSSLFPASYDKNVVRPAMYRKIEAAEKAAKVVKPAEFVEAVYEAEDAVWYEPAVKVRQRRRSESRPTTQPVVELLALEANKPQASCTQDTQRSNKQKLDTAILKLRYAKSFPSTYFQRDNTAENIEVDGKSQMPLDYFAQVIEQAAAVSLTAEEQGEIHKQCVSHLSRVFYYTSKKEVAVWRSNLRRPLPARWNIVIEYYLQS